MADSDKILTFCTITTLLEMLQCLNGTPAPMGYWQFLLQRGYNTFLGKPESDSDSDSDSESQYEYLAALAILLARDNEFVAVAITHQQDTVWELTICNHEERPKTTVIPSDTVTHSSMMRESFSTQTPDACDVDPINPFPYLRKTW
jgi:hypothetical protein